MTKFKGIGEVIEEQRNRNNAIYLYRQAIEALTH